MAFWADFEPQDIEDLRRWHNCEHMLERVSIPGFLHGRRYRGNGKAQTFLMYYETVSAAVLGGADYRAALDNPTAWTKDALKLFRNPERNIYSLHASDGEEPANVTPFLETIRFNLTEAEDEIIAAYCNDILPALVEMPAVHRARLYTIDEAISGMMTTERQIYGGGPGQQKFLLFMELGDEPEPFEPADLPGMAAAHSAAHTNVFSEVGWLDFWLDSPEV